MKNQLYFKRKFLYKAGKFEEAAKVQEQINSLTKDKFLKPIQL